jgi:transposase
VVLVYRSDEGFHRQSFEVRAMRGPDVMQDTLFAVRSLESYVPTDHPLRPVRDILNEALERMDPLFAAMYAPAGRDSIAPEKLLRGLMLQVLYGVRSERMLVEQLGYNLLFRWFVGVSMQDDPWDHSTFSKNRDRLIKHDACAVLFEEVLAQARAKGLLSAEHFSVDGTLVRAWPRTRASCPRMGHRRRRAGRRATPKSISAVSRAPTIRMRAAPTPMRSSIARARMPRRCRLTWVMR